MDSIVVKTEMQSNGEILLFYVDENGGNEEGVLTTVESIENQAMQLQQDNSYIIQDMVDSNENADQSTADNWTDDEINRLLVFYNDNKQTFINGTTKKQHLWTVACKTMLLGKNPNSCEAKLLSLQTKYNQICENIQKGLYEEWPYFQLCHNIFQDESPVITIETVNSSEPQIIKVPALKQNFDNVMMVKKINKPAVDEKVHTMLTLYLKYKKNFQEEYWRRGLWETIAMEMGEDDGEYWQKRFLNYKQHYLRLLDKRRDSGNEGINWPYMDLFDKIFEGDQEFNRKYLNEEYRLIENQAIADSEEIPTPEDWLVCEKTVLVKYYFDCYDEFEDRTIPNGFLWNEIGRLLDKPADDCKAKYEELREAHLQKYIDGAVVDLQSRKPVDIVYDHIISKDIQNEMERNRRIPEELEIWKTTELDDLVQFFYDNIQLYKDKICHFVCWAAVAKKLKKTLQSCKSQWDDLVQLYQTILNDKKEHPDMQIDWRYIEVFDRIFDYGMDTNLLVGYDKPKDGAGPKAVQESELGKVGVKRVSIKEEVGIDDFSDDDESFDERGFTKRTKRRAGESKAFKILEYYQKNKDKFSTTNRNKHSLWEVLAKQIGISATQCAHRFRNLKQVYTAYVQREINKPEMPILWPYYALCKKVFGYRAIKSKLKNGKMDSDDSEDWSAKEIKQLINYFSQNFEEIDNFVDDTSKWSDLATDIGKTENACKEKFIELRKSYRKLKTMRSRNPDVKISWKYFNMFEDIYNAKQNGNDEAMEVEELDLNMVSDEKEDDYQCIIVIPEGQDISQIENAQIIIQDPPTLETVPEEPAPTNQPKEVKPIQKWTKRTKKRLIIFYINYIRSHKGKEIKAQEMWKDIASKLNKTVQSCRKMFAKLKANHKQLDKSDPNVLNNPYYSLMAKAMRLKPKYEKGDQNKSLKDGKVYKDVALPDDKVIQALQYYLENIEDFVSPRYEKKYLWTELANYVCEPITKVFNKLNYLKQQYNSDTDEVAGQKTPFGELLKEIQAKEIAVKLVVDNNPKPIIELPDDEETWSDDETEQLLEWYLSNLEKFKNPKYVRSYLWLEVSELLKKSAIACSKKMSDVRTEYRNMVREKPEELNAWRFLDLCQKIYGTGKKGATNISN
ncbi:uncharacterized protein LOC118280646 isoform X2 [Spodoptera frugiperda]|uniref:Uncharacterized protein LOC118280646 isoform X2 n=1 Tax=Spodoptera frugiperda TaxID=7108 RepID=A0A9R0EZV2_SPOFR|nr:uncharacterized protein LOC118280646 isoform X2 [Spodoptera frugiperda]